MTRIEVDFNDLLKGGRVRAAQVHADRPITPGDLVTAFDPYEDMEFEATVAADLGDGWFALQMHWEPAEPAVSGFHLSEARVREAVGNWTPQSRDVAAVRTMRRGHIKRLAPLPTAQGWWESNPANGRTIQFFGASPNNLAKTAS